jgi:hypothetical protein
MIALRPPDFKLFFRGKTADGPGLHEGNYATLLDRRGAFPGAEKMAC